MNQKESRKHQRHNVTDGTLVVLEPYFDLIGKIVDISYGGLSFHYKGKKEIRSDACEVSFMFDNTTENLKYGPFKFSTHIVSDAEIANKNPNNSNGIQCCRMKFQDLSYYQKLWVEACIKTHASEPDRSSMD